jgi:hypothetical protein
MANPFESLPFELVEQILIQLKPVEISRLTTVCRYLASVCQNWTMWADKAWHEFNFPRPSFLNPRPAWKTHCVYQRYREAYSYSLNNKAHLQHFAATGDVDMVEYIIRRHPTLTRTEALGYAAANNHRDVIKIFISVPAGTPDLGYAMSQAIASGHLDLVKFLIQHGVSGDSYYLYIAAINNQLEILRYLIQLGIQPYDQALYGASQWCHFDITRALLELDQPEQKYMDYAQAINNAFNEANARGYNNIMNYLWSIRQRIRLQSV